MPYGPLYDELAELWGVTRDEAKTRVYRAVYLAPGPTLVQDMKDINVALERLKRHRDEP